MNGLPEDGRILNHGDVGGPRNHCDLGLGYESTHPLCFFTGYESAVFTAYDQGGAGYILHKGPELFDHILCQMGGDDHPGIVLGGGPVSGISLPTRIDKIKTGLEWKVGIHGLGLPDEIIEIAGFKAKAVQQVS